MHTLKPWQANRLGLDYRHEAARLGPPPVTIIDVHAHINGTRAAAIYAEAASIFGVGRVYTQTVAESADDVRRALGDSARFLAIPDYMADDKRHAMTIGFIDRIRWWHEHHGARMLKLWAAPRLRDFAGEAYPDVALDGPWKRRAAEMACDMGMMIMTHVADPDTWFRTTYADAARYGTKRSHYEPLERMLADYNAVPWIAAHMAGSPEDLDFLDGLMQRHPHLHLDTSACKWQVRELSRHAPERVRAFLARWQGRILFGSDIVTRDEHLTETTSQAFAADAASSEAEAFELYASRYWAFRTMFETDYQGQSPIADPDLAKEFPDRYDAMSAPTLRGLSLGHATLTELYAGAAHRLVERWYNEH
jgi:hypothetical protein